MLNSGFILLCYSVVLTSRSSHHFGIIALVLIFNKYSASHLFHIQDIPLRGCKAISKCLCSLGQSCESLFHRLSWYICYVIPASTPKNKSLYIEQVETCTMFEVETTKQGFWNKLCTVTFPTLIFFQVLLAKYFWRKKTIQKILLT